MQEIVEEPDLFFHRNIEICKTIYDVKQTSSRVIKIFTIAISKTFLFIINKL